MRNRTREWLLTPEDEVRHLREGPRAHERPAGVGLQEVLAQSDGQSGVLVARAREVLLAVVTSAFPRWSPDVARSQLPRWFIDRCAPEPTAEEERAWLAWWRTLSPAARSAAESDAAWTVDNWLHLVAPDERQWHWWDARTEGPNFARVSIEVSGWPTATGALEWLLKAAGATSVSYQ